MAYNLDIPKKLDRIFLKLSKKDKKQLEILYKKINSIIENPYQFKPLRGNMSGIRRVHVGKSHVLIYEILENEKTIRLLDYAHHDEIYV